MFRIYCLVFLFSPCLIFKNSYLILRVPCTHISCLASGVFCPLSNVPNLGYPLSCVSSRLSNVPYLVPGSTYLVYLVFCFVSCVSVLCLARRVSCLLFRVSYLVSPVASSVLWPPLRVSSLSCDSRLVSRFVSCLVPFFLTCPVAYLPVSCLVLPVPCFMSSPPRLPSPMTCLVSPLSYFCHMPPASYICTFNGIQNLAF